MAGLVRACLLVTCLALVGAEEKKIWMIGSGHDWGAHEYFDKGGYITGFSRDLIAAVCKASGIECRTVWLPYTYCWDSQPGLSTGGIGLMAGYVDACYGYEPTLERVHVFDFSLPFLAELKAKFIVRRGTAATFDATDITNKKIVFLDGWSQNEECLARQDDVTGRDLDPDTQVLHVTTVAEFVEKIVNGDVDAGFAYPHAAEQAILDGTIEAVPGMDFTCGLSGISMMTRKDNMFSDYWNSGFQELRNTGKFKNLCDQAQEEHGDHGSIGCIV